MAKTRVSVCMIVKNEEKYIEKAINSVHDLNNVSEIIVVDTGSTDNTKKLALQFPKVKLYSFKWINDFSAARNFSISKAKGNWIFYMDADEEFRGEFPDEIVPAIYNFKIKNLADDGSFVYSVCSRFAPRDKDVYFINPVHEIWGDPKQKYRILQFTWGEIVHTGYLSACREEKNKSERNLDMLEKDYKEKPTAQKCYYLGQEVFIVRDVERTFELAKEGITLIDQTNALDLTFEPLLYHLYLTSAIELKKFELIPEFEEKYLYKSPHPECFTVLQQYYLSIDNDAKALKMMWEALKLRNMAMLPAKYNENIITFIPFLVQGSYYEQKNDTMMAAVLFEHAHMNGCLDPHILSRIYQWLPKYKDIQKLEYYIKTIFNVTKDQNILKELVNIYLNSPEESKWAEAAQIMNQIAGAEELQFFKSKLIENGKNNIAELIRNKMPTRRLASELFDEDLENVFTVVIPTLNMVEKKYFDWNLNILKENKLVKRVIVIDNSDGEFINDYNSNKIEVIKQENIGVNASWNMGVHLTDTPYYLILNDDCMIKPHIIDSCVNILENDKDVNILTVKTNNISYDDFVKCNDTSSIDIYEDFNYAYPKTTHGWFIVGRKENWHQIPAEFKMFFGDDFIHLHSNVIGKQNVILISNDINHQTSTTVNNTMGSLNDPNSKYSKTLQEERILFEGLLANLKKRATEE